MGLASPSHARGAGPDGIAAWRLAAVNVTGTGVGRASEPGRGGAAGSLDLGSGASSVTTMAASGRVGSFSPAGPVSTLRVTRVALVPFGGAFTTNSARAAGGREM